MFSVEIRLDTERSCTCADVAESHDGSAEVKVRMRFFYTAETQAGASPGIVLLLVHVAQACPRHLYRKRVRADLRTIGKGGSR